MREFRAFEYVDGDLKIYVREEGEGDDAWRELGMVPFKDIGKLKSCVAVSEYLGLKPAATLTEGQSLWQEFTNPRRW